ncbi:MAG: hypothetical protein AB1427_15580 [Thermodesulfobacteriota bacterium]
MRAFLKCGLFMAVLVMFVFVYLSLPYFASSDLIACRMMIFGKDGAGFLVITGLFVFVALVITILAHYGCRVVGRKMFEKKRIGDLFVSIRLITPEELAAAVSTRNLKIEEILSTTAMAAVPRGGMAPGYRKDNYAKMGDMLIKLGFSTDDEIQWALSQNRKKIIKTLKGSNRFTAEEGAYAAILQRYRPKWNSA